MGNLRTKFLSKLDTDSLGDYVRSKLDYWEGGIDEQFVKDLSQLNIKGLDILDTLWADYSYWMILHFKTKITKTQLDGLLDNQHIVSALAHILDEEQVMRVIGNGIFGLSVGDVLRDNVHYKRRYGIF